MHQRPHEPGGLDPAERELEIALGALRPARPSFSRDRVLFEAGAAVGRERARRAMVVWRAAAAVVTLALVGSVVRPSHDRQPPTVQERIVYVERETPDAQAGGGLVATADDTDEGPPGAEALDPPLVPPGNEYLALRRRVLRRGVDGVRTARAAFAPDQTLTARDVRRGLALSPG